MRLRCLAFPLNARKAYLTNSYKILTSSEISVLEGVCVVLVRACGGVIVRLAGYGEG